MLINYPKVKADSEGRIFVLFFQNNKRYRIFNGSKINSKIHPNRYPISERIAMGKILASEVYAFLMSGLTIQQAKVSELITPNMSDKDYLYIALKNKLKVQNNNEAPNTLKKIKPKGSI